MSSKTLPLCTYGVRVVLMFMFSSNFAFSVYFQLNVMRASELDLDTTQDSPQQRLQTAEGEMNKVTSGDALEMIQKSIPRTMLQEPFTITGKEYRSFADKGGRVGLKHT